MFRHKQLIITIFLSSVLLTSISNAQNSATSEIKAEDVEKENKGLNNEVENFKSPNNGRVEKLEVTGSHIRRTDIEGPSPVLIIDRESIQKSGFNSVGAILNRSAVSPFGGSGSAVSLKGIGSGRTLVLINGQRAPGSGSSYASGAVSVDFVPIAAVERIEVLKDGASATYGSDALGGVINIITRKDLDGFSFANKYDMTNANGSDTNLMSLAYGAQTAKTNFLSSLQVSYSQGSRSSDFDYAKDLNKSFVFSTNYIGDGATGVQPGPNCTLLNSSGRCEEYVSPKQVNKNSYGADWVTDFSLNLKGDTTLYTTFIAGYGRAEDEFPNILNTPGQFIGFELTGAETPAAWNTLPNYTGGDTTIWHRFDDYVNTTIDQNYYTSVILGLKGYIGESDWQWNVATNNQININESKEKNLGTVSGAKAAIIAHTYDPFDPNVRDTSGLGIDALNRNRAVVNWVEAKANGDIGSLLGFDWSSAFGISGAHFEYADHRAADILNGNVMLQSGVAGRGARELYSVFSEFGGLYGRSFELQFSMRGDLYSDFGSTFNPKVAARYKATNWLTFRTSGGTGFQAPTLQNMNAKIEGYDFLVDQVRCKDPLLGNSDPNDTDCSTQSVSVFQDNNANLKQETSISLNVGAIVEPTKNLNFALDWWYVKVSKTIGTRLEDILLLEQRNAATPGLYGVNIIRDGGAPDGRITRIEYRLQNLGQEEVNGVDFSINYKIPTSFGQIYFNNEATYLNHYFQSFYAELGKQQVLGQFGKPRWRNNFTTGVEFGNYNFQTTARSVATVEKNVRGLGSIQSVTQIDLMLSYDPKWAGQFQLGALNLLNVRPQFDKTYSSRVNGALYRRIETYYLTYRQDF